MANVRSDLNPGAGATTYTEFEEKQWASKSGPVEVTYREPQAPRFTLIARKNGTCLRCRDVIRIGDQIRGTRGRWAHLNCSTHVHAPA